LLIFERLFVNCNPTRFIGKAKINRDEEDKRILILIPFILFIPVNFLLPKDIL